MEFEKSLFLFISIFSFFAHALNILVVDLKKNDKKYIHFTKFSRKRELNNFLMFINVD